MASGGSLPLTSVIAYVHSRIDGDNIARVALNSKLKELGAKASSRLSKEITHIIFSRKLQPSAHEKALEDAELRQLYEYAANVELKPCVVSPAWLQACSEQAIHVQEARYIIKRPPDPIFIATTMPHSAMLAAAAQRKRRSSGAARMLLPREAVELDVDDPMFSSSQQIRLGPGAGTDDGRPPLKRMRTAPPLPHNSNSVQAAQTAQARHAPLAAPDIPSAAAAGNGRYRPLSIAAAPPPQRSGSLFTALPADMLSLQAPAAVAPNAAAAAGVASPGGKGKAKAVAKQPQVLPGQKSMTSFFFKSPPGAKPSAAKAQSQNNQSVADASKESVLTSPGGTARKQALAYAAEHASGSIEAGAASSAADNKAGQLVSRLSGRTAGAMPSSSHKGHQYTTALSPSAARSQLQKSKAVTTTASGLFTSPIADTTIGKDVPGSVGLCRVRPGSVTQAVSQHAASQQHMQATATALWSNPLWEAPTKRDGGQGNSDGSDGSQPAFNNGHMEDAVPAKGQTKLSRQHSEATPPHPGRKIRGSRRQQQEEEEQDEEDRGEQQPVFVPKALLRVPGSLHKGHTPAVKFAAERSAGQYQQDEGQEAAAAAAACFSPITRSAAKRATDQVGAGKHASTLTESVLSPKCGVHRTLHPIVGASPMLLQAPVASPRAAGKGTPRLRGALHLFGSPQQQEADAQQHPQGKRTPAPLKRQLQVLQERPQVEVEVISLLSQHEPEPLQRQSPSQKLLRESRMQHGAVSLNVPLADDDLEEHAAPLPRTPLTRSKAKQAPAQPVALELQAAGVASHAPFAVGQRAGRTEESHAVSNAGEAFSFTFGALAGSEAAVVIQPGSALRRSGRVSTALPQSQSTPPLGGSSATNTKVNTAANTFGCSGIDRTTETAVANALAFKAAVHAKAEGQAEQLSSAAVVAAGPAAGQGLTLQQTQDPVLQRTRSLSQLLSSAPRPSAGLRSSPPSASYILHALSQPLTGSGTACTTGTTPPPGPGCTAGLRLFGQRSTGIGMGRGAKRGASGLVLTPPMVLSVPKLRSAGMSQTPTPTPSPPPGQQAQAEGSKLTHGSQGMQRQPPPSVQASAGAGIPSEPGPETVVAAAAVAAPQGNGAGVCPGFSFSLVRSAADQLLQPAAAQARGARQSVHGLPPKSPSSALMRGRSLLLQDVRRQQQQPMDEHQRARRHQQQQQAGVQQQRLPDSEVQHLADALPAGRVQQLAPVLRSSPRLKARQAPNDDPQLVGYGNNTLDSPCQQWCVSDAHANGHVPEQEACEDAEAANEDASPTKHSQSLSQSQPQSQTKQQLAHRQRAARAGAVSSLFTQHAELPLSSSAGCVAAAAPGVPGVLTASVGRALALAPVSESPSFTLEASPPGEEEAAGKLPLHAPTVPCGPVPIAASVANALQLARQKHQQRLAAMVLTADQPALSALRNGNEDLAALLGGQGVSPAPQAGHVTGLTKGALSEPPAKRRRASAAGAAAANVTLSLCPKELPVAKLPPCTTWDSKQPAPSMKTEAGPVQEPGYAPAGNGTATVLPALPLPIQEPGTSSKKPAKATPAHTPAPVSVTVKKKGASASESTLALITSPPVIDEIRSPNQASVRVATLKERLARAKAAAGNTVQPTAHCTVLAKAGKQDDPMQYDPIEDSAVLRSAGVLVEDQHKQQDDAVKPRKAVAKSLLKKPAAKRMGPVTAVTTAAAAVRAVCKQPSAAVAGGPDGALEKPLASCSQNAARNGNSRVPSSSISTLASPPSRSQHARGSIKQPAASRQGMSSGTIISGDVGKAGVGVKRRAVLAGGVNGKKMKRHAGSTILKTERHAGPLDAVTSGDAMEASATGAAAAAAADQMNAVKTKTREGSKAPKEGAKAKDAAGAVSMVCGKKVTQVSILGLLGGGAGARKMQARIVCGDAGAVVGAEAGAIPHASAAAAGKEGAGSAAAAAATDAVVLVGGNGKAVTSAGAASGVERSNRPGAAAAAGGAMRYIAHTAVDAGTAALVQAAVRKLGAARACVDGWEDGRVTHLVMGAERRTLKALLAVASGAVLVSPEWLRASLAASRWLPEEDHAAQVTYTHVAQAVRSQRVASNKQPPSQSAAYANTASQSQPNPKQGSSQHKPVADSASCSTGSTTAIQYRPLSGKALCVYCPLADSARGGSGGSNGSGSVSGSGSGLAASLGAGPSSAALQSGLQAHKAALEKLVQALGGRVVPVRSASLVVLAAGVTAPPSLLATPRQTKAIALQDSQPHPKHQQQQDQPGQDPTAHYSTGEGALQHARVVVREEWLLQLAEQPCAARALGYGAFVVSA